MAREGEIQKAPCTGSDKCKSLRYTKWIYKYTLLGGWHWQCMTCGRTR